MNQSDQAADTRMMAAEDFERYSESVEALCEHEAAVEYAANKARTEARAEGHAEVRAEGFINVIRNMLNYGMSKSQVADINNMTVAELDSLLGLN